MPPLRDAFSLFQVSMIGKEAKDEGAQEIPFVAAAFTPPVSVQRLKCSDLRGNIDTRASTRTDDNFPALPMPNPVLHRATSLLLFDTTRLSRILSSCVELDSSENLSGSRSC